MYLASELSGKKSMSVLRVRRIPNCLPDWHGHRTRRKLQRQIQNGAVRSHGPFGTQIDEPRHRSLPRFRPEAHFIVLVAGSRRGGVRPRVR